MKTFQEILRWFVIICVFALPVIPWVVAYSMFFPYITGKNFDFRIIVELMTGAYLALALMVPKYRPRRSWILLAFAIFVLIMGIADIQGVNPLKSIWSNYERMDGWITIVHLLLYIAISASVLATENLWRRLFQWSLVISLLLSIFGILQVANVVATGQGGGGGLEARIDATFGNPIYLAVYMLFQIFIAALLWAQMWRKTDQGKRLWPSLFYTAVIIFDLIALLFTGTRGATLGLIGGAFLALLLFAFSSEASKRLRQATIIIFVLAVALGGGLRLAKNTPFVHSIGFLDRLASLGDDTTVARFINTEIALKGIAEKPILGWGQENFAVVFDKYYDPRMYAQEQWFDRVHDTVFDMWVAGGTLGLLAYLSIFAAALWALWRPSGERGSTEASRPNVRPSSERGSMVYDHKLEAGRPNVRRGAFSAAERSILIGLLAGYFVQNLTVFDNVTSWILFGTILGYIAFRAADQRKTRVLFETELLPQSLLPVAGLVGIALGVGAAWSINYPAYAENRGIIAALQAPQSIQDLQTNLAAFAAATSYHTFGDQEAREQLAQRAMQVVGNSSVPADLKKQFVDTAVAELDKQATVSPLDARFPLFAAGVLDAAGDYAHAKTYLDRAHELSPGKQTILYEMAQNALLRGDNATGIADFKQAFELDTDNQAARSLYASTLIVAGKDQEADAVLAPIIASGAAATAQITSAYASKGEFQKLIPIWQAYVSHSPQDKDGYLTLAGAYYKLGDKTGAIQTLQELEKAMPAEKSATDALIQQIQTGTVPQ